MNNIDKKLGCARDCSKYPLVLDETNVCYLTIGKFNIAAAEYCVKPVKAPSII
jgi:hypothetical protein